MGSLNSPTGVLSDISKSRLNYCAYIYKKGDFVLCTGGWGAHFNTSAHSHASYAKQYLIEKGVSEDDFLELALSGHTVDDAVKKKPILSQLDHIKLSIITSDYHQDRVKLIFNEILEGFTKEFIGVDSGLVQEDYEAAVVHEQKAIASILQNGLYY